jgi:hypothetical protein
MNTKIDETNDFDFGITYEDRSGKTPDAEKIQQLLALIEPLLDNLAKDPQKTTITWAKRGEVITKIKARINQIVAS